jgi:hypothetical protein
VSTLPREVAGVEWPRTDCGDGAGRLDDRLFVACGLAWAAGLVHAVVTLAHLSGYVPFTAFFALAGAAQIGWGIVLYRSPGRGLLVAGALLSAAIAAIWLLSRMKGLPIGPDAWEAKPVGVLQSVATLDEIALVLMALLALRPRRTGRIGRAFRLAGTSLAVYLLLLSSLALMPGSAEDGVGKSLTTTPRAGLKLLCSLG